MIYVPPSLQGFVPRRLRFSTWIDHLPFGYDLVAALRPSFVVELGTEGGLSYFCFCQSIAEQGISARCYAVDTWAGDEHTGAYDERVFEGVSTHNAKHYGSFSSLLRMRFEEAVARFDDGSLELLHIDGLHTYEAVRNDFETWFPKVKPGGIVLLHDIDARLDGFGVWRFWAELESKFSTFAFRHGFGLGVLRKPGGALPGAPLFEFLFEGDDADREQLRAFYAHAAEYQELIRRRDRRPKRASPASRA